MAAADKPVGRPFEKGKSGNPGGRPKGLASSTRRLLDEAAEAAGITSGDGAEVLGRFWINVLSNVNNDLKLRIAASDRLAERAYGKPATFAPIEDEDPLDTKERDEAIVREFRDRVARLRVVPDDGSAADQGPGAADRPDGG